MYDPNYLHHENAACPTMMPMGFQGHGDGYKDYYDVDDIQKEEDPSTQRTPPSHRRKRQHRRLSHSSSESEISKRSVSKSRSGSRSRSRSKSNSSSATKPVKFSNPSFLDAFRVLYLTTNKQNKNTTKFLATKKKQDRIQELLKSDGLGSKHWLFYPRKNKTRLPEIEENIPEESCDRRIKIDGDFFRKYKKNKKVDSDSPIAKLKRWELILYEKLGFIETV